MHVAVNLSLSTLSSWPRKARRRLACVVITKLGFVMKVTHKGSLKLEAGLGEVRDFICAASAFIVLMGEAQLGND